MAGGIVDIMKKLKMVQDEDPYDEFEDEIEEDEKPEKPVKQKEKRSWFRAEEPEEEEEDDNRPDAGYGSYSNSSEQPRTQRPAIRLSDPEPRETSKVLTLSGKEHRGQADLCTIVVKDFEDCFQVAELLLEDRGVILNMDNIDMALAQRIMDFVSGACYMQNGNLQPVTKKVFIVTPRSISLSGDFGEPARKKPRNKR